MLGKLIKHEFLADAKVMGPSYLVVLGLALLGRILTWIATRKVVEDALPLSFIKVLHGAIDIVSVLFVLAFIALIILTIFFMAYRFYKNFFTDEGYLMMTLPATPKALVFSKLVNAIIWSLFSIIVALASVFISLGESQELVDTVKQLWEAIGQLSTHNSALIQSQVGVSVPVLVVEIIVFALIYIIRFMMSWYFAVAFGQLISKNHKVLGGILAYFILEIASQIISAIYIAINTNLLPKIFPSITESSGAALQSSLIGNGIVLLLVSAVLYFIICRIMTRRLNLD
jgi:hypothetical protein